MSESAEEAPISLGDEIGGPGRVYFDDPFKDNIMDALLEACARIWTVEDRMMVLERVLEAKGLDVSAEIERHKPDEAERQVRAAARKEFVDAVLASFIRRP
ncbi:MAG: hypothetical protein AAGL49_14615 [Pseudomonadota bacterium]